MNNYIYIHNHKYKYNYLILFPYIYILELLDNTPHIISRGITFP